MKINKSAMRLLHVALRHVSHEFDHDPSDDDLWGLHEALEKMGLIVSMEVVDPR